MRLRYRHSAVSTCLVIALLAGCGQDAQEPIQEAVPADEAVAPAVEAEGPVSLRALFAASDARLREVHPEALEEVQAGMSCSLDSVNGALPGSGLIEALTPVSISGWFQHPQASGDQVVAVLRGDKAYAFKLNIGSARPDVAKAIGASDHVSDVVGTSATGVPAGDYSIYYVREGASGLAKCVGDRKIQVG